jgi:predicted RNase H-like nuclease (RuvC/YqgF family)
MSDIYNGRMIPLHIADKAIINCNKEIEKLQIENARLKAEVERLTAENASVKLGNAELRQMVIERGETAVEDIRVICRLEAEVERLTKAGDAMAEEIALAKRQDEGSRFDPIEMHYDHELIVKWNAAKEGKGQP